jgi:diaminopimelate decarboxylase
VPTEVNLGGGLAIPHTREQPSPEPGEWVRRMRDVLDSGFAERGLPSPALAIEPGRSIAGPAGVTLYRVGTIKSLPGGKRYVAVDGGMSDNIRPALYDAPYEVAVAGRMHAPRDSVVTVVGKHCESGDVLVDSVSLPRDIARGDVVCVPATGAYTYSMASNYNRVRRPAVVMVDAGKAVVIVAREGYDDVLRSDRACDGSRVDARAIPGGGGTEA